MSPRASTPRKKRNASAVLIAEFELISLTCRSVSIDASSKPTRIDLFDFFYSVEFVVARFGLVAAESVLARQTCIPVCLSATRSPELIITLTCCYAGFSEVLPSAFNL